MEDNMNTDSDEEFNVDLQEAALQMSVYEDDNYNQDPEIIDEEFVHDVGYCPTGIENINKNNPIIALEDGHEGHANDFEFDCNFALPTMIDSVTEEVPVGSQRKTWFSDQWENYKERLAKYSNPVAVVGTTAGDKEVHARSSYQKYVAPEATVACSGDSNANEGKKIKFRRDSGQFFEVGSKAGEGLMKGIMEVCGESGDEESCKSEQIANEGNGATTAVVVENAKVIAAKVQGDGNALKKKYVAPVITKKGNVLHKDNIGGHGDKNYKGAKKPCVAVGQGKENKKVGKCQTLPPGVASMAPLNPVNSNIVGTAKAVVKSAICGFPTKKKIAPTVPRGPNLTTMQRAKEKAGQVGATTASTTVPATAPHNPVKPQWRF